jgi:hypothetical protein
LGWSANGSSPRGPRPGCSIKCIAYAKVHRHPEFVGLTIWEVFEAERPKLAPADRRDAALSFFQENIP